MISNINNNDNQPVNEQVPTPKQEEVLITESSRKENKKYIFVEKEVRSYFEDIPEMIQVAYCESRFRQADSEGNTIRGVVNSKDVGVMQVNEHYHQVDSEELGYDIYDLKGNMAYARYLYEREGLQPWSASKPCWGPKIAKLKTEAKLALNKK